MLQKKCIASERDLRNKPIALGRLRSAVIAISATHSTLVSSDTILAQHRTIAQASRAFWSGDGNEASGILATIVRSRCGRGAAFVCDGRSRTEGNSYRHPEGRLLSGRQGAANGGKEFHAARHRRQVDRLPVRSAAARSDQCRQRRLRL